MHLISELRRRNVRRMAAIYTELAWVVIQVTEVLAADGFQPQWQPLRLGSGPRDMIAPLGRTFRVNLPLNRYVILETRPTALYGRHS